MPTDPQISLRKKQLAKTRALRTERLKRREDMLEMLVSGVERRVIADEYSVSVKTLQREVDRAIDERRLETPDRYVRLQVERLHRALRLIHAALDIGELSAVDPLLKVIDKLDRYHGFAAVAPRSPEAPPRLAAPAAPLALTDERT